jgi:dienelactone hydrolase
MRRIALTILSVGVAACGASSGTLLHPGGSTVALTTDDGVALEADLYLTGDAGGPGVILLHEIPPSNTRANYKAKFIDALVSRGMNVINVDRRGAGGSKGNPMDAYIGPNGKLDAKAARDLLVHHRAAIDAHRVAIVGASNGSATAVDFTIAAAGDPTLGPPPSTLVFLTGGTYTEAQNSFADHRAVLDAIPILFVYSREERAWSAGLSMGAPSAWSFKEYSPGEHGTRMFDVQPAAIDDVAEFLRSKLEP